MATASSVWSASLPSLPLYCRYRDDRFAAYPGDMHHPGQSSWRRVIYATAPMASQSFTVEYANPLTGTSFGAVNIGSTSSVVALTLTFNATADTGQRLV